MVCIKSIIGLITAETFLELEAQIPKSTPMTMAIKDEVSTIERVDLV